MLLDISQYMTYGESIRIVLKYGVGEIGNS